MTKEEFVNAYAKRSGITVEDLRRLGRDAFPCQCRDPICEGWQMRNAKEYSEDLAAYERGEGPRP